jgi:hypothetical protein
LQVVLVVVVVTVAAVADCCRGLNRLHCRLPHFHQTILVVPIRKKSTNLAFLPLAGFYYRLGNRNGILLE